MRSLVVLCAAILAMGWVKPALAADATEKKPSRVEYNLSLLGGYGTGPRYQYDDGSRYGAALGGRAGLTLSMPKLYLGLSFVHFAGSSDGDCCKIYTNTLDTEFGYEFQLLQDRLLIRPQVGLGVVEAVTVQPDNEGHALLFHGAPGILVGVRVAPLLISAEYRRDMVSGEHPDANTMLLGFGLRL